MARQDLLLPLTGRPSAQRRCVLEGPETSVPFQLPGTLERGLWQAPPRFPRLHALNQLPLLLEKEQSGLLLVTSQRISRESSASTQKRQMACQDRGAETPERPLQGGKSGGGRALPALRPDLPLGCTARQRDRRGGQGCALI